MGWWQITTDYSGLAFGQPKPGPDQPEFFNGDQPADAAGLLWEQVHRLLTPAQFADALATGDLPPALSAQLSEPLTQTRAAITAAYQQAWGRPPHEAEWRGVADFTAVPLDEAGNPL